MFDVTPAATAPRSSSRAQKRPRHWGVHRRLRSHGPLSVSKTAFALADRMYLGQGAEYFENVFAVGQFRNATVATKYLSSDNSSHGHRSKAVVDERMKLPPCSLTEYIEALRDEAAAAVM